MDQDWLLTLVASLAPKVQWPPTESVDDEWEDEEGEEEKGEAQKPIVRSRPLIIPRNATPTPPVEEFSDHDIEFLNDIIDVAEEDDEEAEEKDVSSIARDTTTRAPVTPARPGKPKKTLTEDDFDDSFFPPEDRDSALGTIEPID